MEEPLLTNASSQRGQDSAVELQERQCQGFHDGANHVQQEQNDAARRKLVMALAICSLAVIVEVAGGLMAHSLALLTDAAHLLSDLSGYLISLFALWATSLDSTAKHSYGFHRVEILGALLSILIIWMVTGVLVVQAIYRMINPVEVDGKLMAVVALFGLLINLMLLGVLGTHGHSHGGRPCGSQGHGHSEGVDAPPSSHGSHGHAHGDRPSSHGHGSHPDPPKKLEPSGSPAGSGCSGGGSHGHSHGHKPQPGHGHSQVDEHKPQPGHGHSHVGVYNPQGGHGQEPTGHAHNGHAHNGHAHNGHEAEGRGDRTEHQTETVQAEDSAPMTLTQPREHHGHGHGQGHSHGGQPRSNAHSASWPSISPAGDDRRIHISQTSNDAGSNSSEGGEMTPVGFQPMDEGDFDDSRANKHAENINVRAAMIHVMGDLVQTIGVMLSGIAIWINPSWSIADPICTFIFAVLVLLTTWKLLRDVVDVLMERTPRDVNLLKIYEAIWNVEGVVGIHCLHVWALTSGKNLATLHVQVADGTNEHVLHEVEKVLSRKLGSAVHTTIQVTSRGRCCAL